MKKSLWLLMTLLVTAGVQAQQTVKRPKILGISHAGFAAADMENNRSFFRDYLGFAEPVVISDKTGKIGIIYLKINDEQYVELAPMKSGAQSGMTHVAFQTDDAEGMRRYLESKGCNVSKKTTFGRIGNGHISVVTPLGMRHEFIEYRPESKTSAVKGKMMPESRVSCRMGHVGFMTADLDQALAFYVDILGFKEVWRGGKDPKKVSWVHLQVPDGDQTIELMLYETEPTQAQIGSMNHISLEVSDVYKAKAMLDARELPQGCRMAQEIKGGVIRKLHVNCFMADGARVEIMEDHTIDGKLTPSSKGVPMKYVPGQTTR